MLNCKTSSSLKEEEEEEENKQTNKLVCVVRIATLHYLYVSHYGINK
jgi:hypothetical protein